MGKRKYKYDAFISHAVEDKISIANELDERLKAAGLAIWYSGREFTIGDSIHNSIYQGLAESRYGIVIFSPTSMQKIWPTQELYALLYEETKGEQKILPVLHNTTLAEVVAKFPFMEDRWCVSTDGGPACVADEIIRKIYKDRPAKTASPGVARYVMTVATIALMTVLGFLAYLYFSSNSLPPETIKQAVEKRIALIDETIRVQRLEALKQSGAVPAGDKKISDAYHAYHSQRSYYRNEYEFHNGYSTARARKNVQAVLAVNISNLTPETGYGLDSVDMYILGERAEGMVRYAIVNRRKPTYRLGDIAIVNDTTCAVDLIFESDNVRYIEVALKYAETPRDTRRHSMTLWGFLPTEKLWFVQRHDRWTFLDVR